MFFEQKILIVAEHASLKFGGEAALPLHYFRTMRKRNLEAWLIIHERTRKELETLFPQHRDRIYYISDTFIHRFLFWCGKFLPQRLDYFTFGLLMRLITQIMQRRIAKQVIQEQEIDIIHQPIPVSPKEPSIMFNLGVPVVIGPMNGGMRYPDGFRQMNSIVSNSIEIGRIFANFVNKLIPGKRKATTLLVANQRTKEALPEGVRGKVIELVENGVDLAVWRLKSQSKQDFVPKRESLSSLTHEEIFAIKGDMGQSLSSGETIEYSKPIVQGATKFVFIGRLVHWKAVDLLILAFERVCKKVPVELEIIGEGVKKEALELQAKELGLIKSLDRESVHFTGWLSQAECAEKLQFADILVLPSLLECGGAVVLEAMTMGLPVIATNWGGPADYIDESCGILVEPKSRDFLIDNLANAMVKMAKSSELRHKMGQAGRQRIFDYFDWEVKLDRMLEIYRETFNRYKLKEQK